MEGDESSSGLDFDFDLSLDEASPRTRNKPLADIDDEKLKSFEKWEKLAAELKSMAVEKMDYFTRTKLSYCSRNDYDVVSSTPIGIARIEIKDNGDMNYAVAQGEEIESVYVQILFDEISKVKCKIELHFVKRGEDTEIVWFTYPPRQRAIKKSITSPCCNFYDESIKFVEKWMKKSRYSVKDLTVELKCWPIETSPILFLSQCKNIRICHGDEKVLKWWLSRVDPKKLESLQVVNLDDDQAFSQEFLSMEHFKKCQDLRIWAHCRFTDEQFLSMGGKSIYFESTTISDIAINRFILNWVNGKVRNDFTSLTIWRRRTFDKNTILKNLVVRPWDDEFEIESAGFAGDWARVCGRYDCHQISKLDRSGISATLDLAPDRISFAVTGSMIYWQGRHIPSYSIPSGV